MLKNILLFILILAIIFISGCSIKDCGTDLECFKESAKICSKAKVNLIGEGNNIRVTVRGLTADSCPVSFKIEELSQDIKEKYPSESRVATGKTLNCNIDKKYADYEELDYSEKILNITDNLEKSCSGPIKDLMKGPLKEVIEQEFDKLLLDK